MVRQSFSHRPKSNSVAVAETLLRLLKLVTLTHSFTQKKAQINVLSRYQLYSDCFEARLYSARYDISCQRGNLRNTRECPRCTQFRPILEKEPMTISLPEILGTAKGHTSVIEVSGQVRRFYAHQEPTPKIQCTEIRRGTTSRAERGQQRRRWQITPSAQHPVLKP